MSTNLKFSESEQRQQDYYNRIAEEYDSHYALPDALRYRDQMYSAFFEGYPLHEFDALDAMCGGGQATHFLSGRCRSVTGTDISQEQCAFYKKRFPMHEVQCGSITQTPFESESFDLVVTDSLHHLHPRVNDAVTEIYRILRPGGLLLAWEPSAGSALDTLRKTWYRLDPNYFEENEESIDMEALAESVSDFFNLEKVEYGGNFAYFLVFASMAFRIPPKLVQFYAPPLLWLEPRIQSVQGKIFSAWVLGLLRKKP